MNPMTNIKNLQKINERELELGIIGQKSWHDEYKGSAWIFIGGLPYDLTEGDIICVFSQYGEIVNINLVRDSKTGKSKGYAFICFQDQRSTVLSVDNLNGIKILGRTIRVDHVKDYKMPKGRGDEDEVTLKLQHEGCAPKIESSPEEVDNTEGETKSKRKKDKKKKMKKEKKKRKERDSSEGDDRDSSSISDKQERYHPHFLNMDVKKEKLGIKEEKIDNGFDKAYSRPSARVQGCQHNFADEDFLMRKRISDYGINNDSMTNGVKKEMCNNCVQDRSDAGSDRKETDFRDGTDGQRYDRNKDMGYRENDRQYEGSRDRKYHERDHSYREGRDRNGQRKDNFTKGEYYVHGQQESDDFRSDHRPSDKNVDGERRQYRSGIKDHTHGKKRKHKSRSRSRER